MSQVSETEQEEKKGCGSNLLGLLIFFLIAGSQFVQPALNMLSHVLGQQTSQQLGSSLSSVLPIIIIGLVVLSVIVPILSGVIRVIGRLTQGNDTPAPHPYGRRPSSATSLPAPSRLPASRTGQGGSSFPATSARSSPYGAPFPLAPTPGSTPSSQATQSSSSPITSTWGTYTSTMYTGKRETVSRPIGSGDLDLEQMRTRMGIPQMYQTPGFEPLVDGKVLTFGLLGAMVIGGSLVFGNWLVSVLP